MIRIKCLKSVSLLSLLVGQCSAGSYYTIRIGKIQMPATLSCFPPVEPGNIHPDQQYNGETAEKNPAAGPLSRPLSDQFPEPDHIPALFCLIFNPVVNSFAKPAHGENVSFFQPDAPVRNHPAVHKNLFGCEQLVRLSAG